MLLIGFFSEKVFQGRLFQYRTTLSKTMVSLRIYHREGNVTILLILSTIPDLTKIDFMSPCKLSVIIKMFIKLNGHFSDIYYLSLHDVTLIE